MKKSIVLTYKFLIILTLLQLCVIPKSSNAFFPKINIPKEKELEAKSIEIGKTAIQLIQFGQNDEAIKLLELAVKLNPKEEAL